ncbi:type 2 periplasmic-binding domain-containing protein [Pseudomonas oryzihabitans]|uniref:hypothetical protein n=1 Tax=Pseudomonas oryzihabitans TaxID=47885 RepID=UPI001643B5DB|nr:hypothetical protein [Pseudomonas oryzihabitans]
MESMKEILELISKAKNIRLNFAILLVSVAITTAENYNLLEFGTISRAVLNIFIFVTSVRIIAWVIGATFDYIEKRRTAAQKEVSRQAAQRLADEASENEYQKLKAKIFDLDIEQLYIIQELKKTNTFTVNKNAALFTLKNAGIVNTPAVGKSHESVQLTMLAKKAFESELWDRFPEIKKNSLLRFFRGLEAKEMEAFKYFTDNETRSTSYHNGRSTSYTSDRRILSSYSRSIIFQQPQSGDRYTIDSIAKEALIEVIRDKDDPKWV